MSGKRHAVEYAIRPVGRGASITSGKVAVSGHEHVGVFAGKTGGLVFAPPYSVAIVLAGGRLVSWCVTRRDGASGVGRGDYDWTIELYSWPEDPTLLAGYAIRSRTVIENCWPLALQCPEAHGHRLVVVKSRYEDGANDLFVVLHADGSFSETDDRTLAVALARDDAAAGPAKPAAYRVRADRLPAKSSSSRLGRAWSRYVAALKARRLGPALRARTPDRDREKLQAALEHPLPAELAELLDIADGEFDADGSALGGYAFLGASRIVTFLEAWATICRGQGAPLETTSSSEPEGAIRPQSASPGWIPFAKEPLEPNFVAIDLTPGSAGTMGQVITFGRDERKRRVLFRSLSEFVEWLAGQAEQGHFRASRAGDLVYLEHRYGRLPEAIVASRADEHEHDRKDGG